MSKIIKGEIPSNNGITIIKPDKRAVISQVGITIQREGKPITGEFTRIGFVYLVVDCSPSMAGQKFEQAKRGALDFAKEALVKGYSTGMIQFTAIATHLCEPMRDIEIFKNYLQKMRISGSTNIPASQI